MAWQLHYTSARRGPTGRAGFQFVAETPGLPDGVRAAVTPYLSYRPPPGAPLSPDESELGLFPVSLLYDRVDGRPLLLRSRYLGRDYSGRYGNFFAHAVVAEPEELEGLRPAELWRAPLWTHMPAPGAVLEELDELAPGTALDPEALAAWLATAGPDGSYATLGRLVDAVAGVLARGHGRVVLVADDVELIARWIAVVSYSLPVAAAARLSFVTYTADPDGAAQRLVGTTPDVWAAAQHHASHALAVDLRNGTPKDGGGPGRFARAVAARWRDADLAGLDALAELALLDWRAAGPDGGGPAFAALDGAAALLALCRGDPSVTREDQEAMARLLARRGTAIPAWVWRDLVPGAASMGLELALAVHERAREAGASGVARRCALRVAELALSDPAARARLPDGASAGVPADPGAGLAPRVAAALAGAPDLAEVAAVAAVAARAGTAADPAAVTAAAAALARRGAADLPAAFDACPAQMRDALLDGALAGLAEAGGRELASALTSRTCDLLHEHPERLRAVPAVAVSVLASVGRRRPRRRIAVTGELLRLGAAPGDVGAALEEVWTAPPAAAECVALLEAHAAAVAEHPALAALPSRAFVRLCAPLPPGSPADGQESGQAGGQVGRQAGEALAGADALRLAARVRAVLPDGRAGRDAAVVQAHAAAITADEPERAARALAEVAGTPGATPRLADEAFTGAARRLCRRPPEFRAALLAALPPPMRARVAGQWTAELPARARAGRSPLRGAEVARRNELVEVALRLRGRGAAEPELEAWARAAAGRWLAARQLGSHLAAEPRLLAALRDLLDEARGR